MSIKVIGAGLAGCEAAWQIAQAGVETELYEMKPQKYSPAHHSPNFAELICSNSLKAERVESAAGLLKEEMRRLGSLLMSCADTCRVPAGGALAVDRNAFSEAVTKKITEHPRIHIHHEEIQDIPKNGIVVIATGPLTADALAEKIAFLCGGSLSFFDAAAPIVTAESLAMDKIFAASRYGKGEDDAYLNCPLNKEEYERFYNALISAERAPLHEFDAADPKVYEGCMPVEVMAGRGPDTLRFGPLKPVGLRDPRTGHRPWAVVQLRREDKDGTLYNLVGFQTNLKFGEQKRVFGMIPGLENAEFTRYGVMHRNTFLNSPKVLQSDYSLRAKPNLFFAGQITGVEGYMESASSGIMAGINAVRRLKGKPTLTLPQTTMIGSLSHYIANGGEADFQPMGANFGVMPPLEPAVRDKKARYAAFSERALRDLEQIIAAFGLSSNLEVLQ
ncbi:methylenetetrahydrofolate--tRNA-(uracil(54)-C(5))-methyltransferase (FADH(2)-oxidizing) TrmFO [Caproiciproducens galactitolivorans]|uniref:Methylenetetrahydrofolate--tRNA-(uracil-5-)-methyltransferase TrmFO n=1 Tax=Caproiciproducens galactitolivorans TaxID=642589 RepID=A0A4Z0YFA7_9FIRM|nr:methylenetetrahydrofolate--tRNA-(uracil(54)-C(5))-methyltransferase (FADH(2)-oxidizing) TrmFO [Caproiciproducens galactitolivorans]QEY34236.1 methylenetetrahydrofolate--tRNA-(uracil(54)-C(5))-methyltransferase (FADH(2)-oxidizing) TrmFO [Caproiciproducens galactitolivorans]TGJ78005.1 methylenetetrahydrofolate--tRNA-(uracil-5-)-methyltransferase TrmFO [Caproiciproducens galactitolivorans]